MNESFCLSGCETWSLKLKEEYKLEMFENRGLGKIFGPKEEGDRRLETVGY